MLSKPIADVLRSKKIQQLITVEPGASVAHAVSVMSRSEVGAVLIRQSEGTVEGIFTERDVMLRVVNESRDPGSTPVASVMSREVRRADASTTVDEALRVMIEYGHRHLLVEQGERAVGLVSARDLMSWAILPDEPIAHEGRRGVIRARAEDTVRTLQEGGAER